MPVTETLTAIVNKLQETRQWTIKIENSECAFTFNKITILISPSKTSPDQLLTLMKVSETELAPDVLSKVAVEALHFNLSEESGLCSFFINQSKSELWVQSKCTIDMIDIDKYIDQFNIQLNISETWKGVLSGETTSNALPII